MGRQISFYMYGNDEKDFLDFVASDPDAFIIPWRVESTENALSRDFSSSVQFGAPCFWNKRLCSEPAFDFIERSKSYSVDFPLSEVIQYSPSYFVDKNIRGGRIWIGTSYYDESGCLIKKGESFIKWYESLAKWIKKHVKAKRDLFWLLPGAYKYFEEHSYRMDSFR